MIATEHTPHIWHPWLRIQRLILETRWAAEEWPIVKAELRNALDADRAGGLVSIEYD